jgi:REP element-mobilizing transposase RayT
MEPGCTYHLYTHANGFENLFRSDENYCYFLRRYEHFIPPVAETYAYCLMPNHLHFLIRIRLQAELEATFGLAKTSEVSTRALTDLGGLSAAEKRISKQFSNLFNSYTKSFNKMYNRMGSLFSPNFKREKVTTDEYFTKLIHYIHANPVHHGFVNSIPEWPWSSYHRHATGEPSTLLMGEAVMHWFGSRAQFIQFHQQPIARKGKRPGSV